MRPLRPWNVALWLLVLYLAFDGTLPVTFVTGPGPRVIAVVMESAQVTPQHARIYTAMRASPVADEWKTKGHRIYIIDKDQRTVSESPAELLTRWPQWQQHTLPVLMIGTIQGRLLYAGPLPSSLEEVQQRIRQYGG